METKVLKINPKKIDAAKIEQAAQLIDAGGLAAFPTETVYGIACRVKTDSLEKLNNLKQRSAEKCYTLHIGSKSEVEKYVPTIGMRAKKLIENAWPGPVTIVFELSDEDIEKQKSNLEREVFEILYKDNSIGIRCPDNPIAQALLEKTQNPVVAPSANSADKPAPTDAKQVLKNLSGRIDMLIDGGACKYQQNSTVVKISEAGFEILREGAVSEADLQQISRVHFLFVCSGNTCRSPIAEGLFRKYLAEKLNCDVDHLEKIGYKAISAGTLGLAGAPATAEAVAACVAKGADITAHISRPLSIELIDQSDLIFAMTDAHRQRVIAFEPQSAEKCMLLVEGCGVPDPIGQTQQVYDDCAEIIEEAIKKRISELIL